MDWWDTLKNYGDVAWRALTSGDNNNLILGVAMFIVVVLMAKYFSSQRYVDNAMRKRQRRDERLQANTLACKAITEDFESGFKAGVLSREQVDRLYAELRKSSSFRGVGPEGRVTRPWYYGVAAQFRPEMVKDGVLKRLKNMGWSKKRIKDYLMKKRRGRTQSDMERLATSIKRKS